MILHCHKKEVKQKSKAFHYHLYNLDQGFCNNSFTVFPAKLIERFLSLLHFVLACDAFFQELIQ